MTSGRVRGLVLGAAAADALGLPAEGLPPDKISRRWPGRLSQSFIFGRGMVSDDTDLVALTCRALISRPDDPEGFVRCLGGCMKRWLLTFPSAIGLATLKSCLKLLIGIGPHMSGVRSAGNGPLLRALPIGARFAADREAMERYLVLSTRLTHTDPRAHYASRAVADIAAWSLSEPESPPDPDALAARLRDAAPDDAEWRGLAGSLEASLRAGHSVEEFCRTLGLERGVTGYAYHTAIAGIYAWRRHFGDYEATVTSVIRAGGDTDTVAAVAGGLAGAVTGEQGIPSDWLDGIADWPHGTRNLRAIADALCLGGRAPAYPWAVLAPRSALFFAAVMWQLLLRAAARRARL